MFYDVLTLLNTAGAARPPEIMLTTAPEATATQRRLASLQASLSPTAPAAAATTTPPLPPPPPPPERQPVVCAVARTPVGRFRGGLRGYTAVELGALAAAEALRRAWP